MMRFKEYDDFLRNYGGNPAALGTMNNADEKIKPGIEQLKEAGSHNFTKEFNEGKFSVAKGETFAISREKFKRWLVGYMTKGELEDCRIKLGKSNGKD